MTISVRLCTDLRNVDRHAWECFVRQFGTQALYCDPRWLSALCSGLRHKPYVLFAERGDRLVWVLPLAFIKSILFGRFLVSLPYVNWAGVVAADDEVAMSLIGRAVELADELDVHHLQLRHQQPCRHPSLGQTLTSKVQMRLGLPGSADEAWHKVRSVVRTQVRKAQKAGFAVHWGTLDLLDDFYDVFCQNMRDLGTPVFGRRLFRNILDSCSDSVELCVLRLQATPVAVSLVVHGEGITEAPSASCLRAYRSTAANSLMYWHLIQRAIERGQKVFDFGRSTVSGPTFDFKKKWGAEPIPMYWQYYLRKGKAVDLRPEGGKFDTAIRIWQRLPLGLTRLLGPMIVRGIP